MHLSTISAVSIGFCVSSVAVQRPSPELNPVIDIAARPPKMVDNVMHSPDPPTIRGSATIDSDENGTLDADTETKYARWHREKLSIVFYLLLSFVGFSPAFVDSMFKVFSRRILKAAAIFLSLPLPRSPRPLD